MDRKRFVPLFAAAVVALGAPAALAGDRAADDGWAAHEHADCRCDCGCTQEVHLGDGFFADTGGVGPAFPASYDGGGGGGAEAFGFAGANAGAFASASASARVSISVNFQNHQMMKMHMMKMHMPKKGYW